MHRKWSKVKKNLEMFICNVLKGRVEFFVTNYRKAHDQMGRAYITVDKKEIFNMCTITSECAIHKKFLELKYSQNTNDELEVYILNRKLWNQANEEVIKEGVLGQYDLFNALEIYFNSSIRESLNSENMLIKILALIDKRVGKRTLESLRGSIKNEHELVQYFYRLRCEAEEITREC